MSPPQQVFLDARNARTLLDAAEARPSRRGEVEVSLDLNLTRVTVELEADHVRFGSCLVSLASLETIIKTPRKIHSLMAGGAREGASSQDRIWEPLEAFSD